jgi:hypothetical protein
MELGVSVREKGRTDFIAQRRYAEGNCTHNKGNQGEDRLAEKAMSKVR